MSELDYIGPDELIFNNDESVGIYSGGFNVNSVMMKTGISPIMTVNDKQIGGGENVSDLFNHLVIPNWTLSYKHIMEGGIYKEREIEEISDEEDNIIDDDLHEKLLRYVEVTELKNEKENENENEKPIKNNQNNEIEKQEYPKSKKKNTRKKLIREKNNKKNTRRKK